MISPTDPLMDIVAFYDTHPINEQQILHTLARQGIALDTLTEDLLMAHDQDHFGGVEANDILAAQAGITRHHVVLDVCSGMGGPARYIAHRLGCRVVGLDFTVSRHHSAQRLTHLVGLDHLVRFEHGNALAMPFGDASFDVVMGQEAWCHVPDKARLIAECVRVVKPGGTIAFTDILRRATLSEAEFTRLQRGLLFPTLETQDGYRALLEGHGYSVVACDDLSEDWARILVQRLAMYRGLKDDTIREFGAERFRAWDEIYAFFVGLYSAGELAGARFVARR